MARRQFDTSLFAQLFFGGGGWGGGGEIRHSNHKHTGVLLIKNCGFKKKKFKERK